MACSDLIPNFLLREQWRRAEELHLLCMKKVNEKKNYLRARHSRLPRCGIVTNVDWSNRRIVNKRVSLCCSKQNKSVRREDSKRSRNVLYEQLSSNENATEMKR